MDSELIPSKSKPSKKKSKVSYACSNCGVIMPKWVGRCPECNTWNSLEEINTDVTSQTVSGIDFVVTHLEDIDYSENNRIHTGFAELDRALGGGVVPGSTILIGGEPGIGKST